MFKIFPATVNHEHQKVPLIKNWYEQATNNPDQIKLWQELFKNQIRMFGIPCGSANDVVVLDVDVKKVNGFESLKSLGLGVPITLVQHTPSGGMHFFFKPKPGVTYGNSVNSKLGLDVRGERGWIAYYNFLNPGVPLAEAPDWLADGTLKNKKEATQQPQGAPIKFAPEIAQAMIQESLEAIRNAPEGESNNTLNKEGFKVGQLVASGSIGREYAEAILLRAALDRGKPAYESKATIASALDGAMTKPVTSPFVGEPVPQIEILPLPGPPERWTPKKFSIFDLQNVAKLRKPQLFEHWSTEDIHIETADGGTGKTTLKLYEAVCLALGAPFLGFQPKQAGSTLFITGEDTSEKLGAMIGAICKQMGLMNPENKDKLDIVLNSIHVKKDADLCLITKDKQGLLHPNRDALTKVLQAIEDIKPKMIVFDPIANFWGSESAVNDMARAVIKFVGALVEESQACVVMINHMGKVSSSSKDMSQFAGRGGTGLPSNSRVSRVLRPVFEEEYQELTGEQLLDGQGAMMCVVNKFTDGSPLYNKPFLIVRSGWLFTRKELTPQKAREVEKQLSDAERVFQFIQEERSNDRYPTKNVIIAHFRMVQDKISKERVIGALDGLQYHGHMGQRIKPISHPDETLRDRAYVITDQEGKEL